MVQNCTESIVTFSFSNSTESPSVPVTVTVDFYLLRNSVNGNDAFIVNSLDPNILATYIGQTFIFPNLLTQWRFSLTLPANQSGFIDVAFSLYNTEELFPGRNIIRYEATDGIDYSTGLITEPNIKSSDPVISIGSSPTDVTLLSAIADGTPGGLDIPPGNTSQNILINGTLKVDTDYNFADLSNIYMNPGATIEIIQGSGGPSTFQLTDMARVEGCDGLWNGIVVTSGNTLIVDGGTDNSSTGKVEIRDAANAIVANSNTTVTVNETRFVDNVLGVTTPNFPNTTIYSDLSITNNIFEGSGLNAAPLAGVEINNLGKVLTLTDNVYRGMTYGLVTRNSSVVSVRESFDNILVQGIKATGRNTHSLLQIGMGPNVPSFNICGTGIFARAMRVTSRNNLMRTMQAGYVFDQGIWADVTVADNIINADLFGIGFEQWRAFRADVTDNTINMQSPSTNGVGIFANQLRSAFAQFSGNDINMQDGRIGIAMEDCSRVAANDNTIDMSIGGTAVLEGIKVDGGIFNTLSCNGIFGLGSGGDQAGIFYTMTSLANISCNTVDDTGIGILAHSTNTSTLQGNLLNDHGNGIQVGETNVVGGEIGEQFHGGNLWAGSYDNVGAAHYGSDPEVANSKLLVNPNDVPPTSTVYRSTDHPPGEFFDQDFNGNAFVCNPSNPACPPDPDNFNDEITDRDKELVKGHITPDYYATEQDWTAKRHLYQRLLLDPSLIVPNSEIDSFYNANTSTTIGRFEQVRKGIDDLFVTDSTTAVQLKSNQLVIDAQMENMAVIMEELDDDPTPQEKAGLLAQMEAAQDTVGGHADFLASLTDSLEIARASAAAQLLSTNNAITATAIYETNQQRYNRIWLTMLLNRQYEPDSLQADTLLYIAGQCPFAGGEAVIQARALLGNANIYNDLALCTPPIPLKKPVSSDGGISFNLFPNPASGYLTIKMDERLQDDGTATITNSLGQTLLSQRLKPGDREVLIVLDDLPNGLFYLTVASKSQSSTKSFTNLK